MRVRTDDEVYRVDGVWLGPPKATFPWRARYVAWGVGTVVFVLVLAVERRLGIGFGFFSTAWALIITVALTRLISSRISHERPLGAVMTMWLRELTAPRERTTGIGGAVSAGRLRIHRHRPRPKHKRARTQRISVGGNQEVKSGRQATARALSGNAAPGAVRQGKGNKRAVQLRTEKGTASSARPVATKEVRGVRSPTRP